MHRLSAMSNETKAPKKERSTNEDSPPADPAYTGLPAKEGGGKETERERYKEHDQ